jgi:CxxC-x17-CxxC domain-containing protein
MNKYKQAGNFGRQRGKDRPSGRFGSKGSFRGGFDKGDRYSRPGMHKATCDECGATCEVPFKPTGGRPVFCNNCFGNQSGGFRPGKSSGSRQQRLRHAERQMHQAVCAACGASCQVPFRPTSDKPIYCDNCFGKVGSSNQSDKVSQDVLQAINGLSAKIDSLVKTLAPEPSSKQATSEKKPTAKTTAKKKTKTRAAAKRAPAKKKKK